MKKKWKKFSEIYRFGNLRESFVEQIEIKQNKIALEICDSETDESNKWGESWKYSEKKKHHIYTNWWNKSVFRWKEKVILQQTFSMRKPKGIYSSQRKMMPEKNSDLNFKKYLWLCKVKMIACIAYYVINIKSRA